MTDTDDENQVPVIDISSFVNTESYSDSDRQKVASLWDDAMATVGFALIVGHGVDSTKVDALRAGLRSFFEGTDTKYKSSFCYGPYGNSKGGYTAVGGEAVVRSQDGHGGLGNDDVAKHTAQADPVESFVCKYVNENDGTPCPEHPTEFKNAAAEYYSEMRRVLDCLHRISEVALGLTEGYLEPFYHPQPNCYVVAKYYPPNSASALRYGAHTDYTGFTILKQDDSDSTASGGLQVRLKSGEWQPVKPRADAFVVNLGDLYEDWTNGRWTSAAHRVVSPDPESEAARVSRLSLPFFTGPHDDALINTLPTCLPADGEKLKLSAPIRAGDHLRRKLEATQV